jgi:hypothetical protein
VTTNKVLAERARQVAGQAPAGSPDRRAFACASIALSTTSTIAAARKVLQADCPEVARPAALQALTTLTRPPEQEGAV